MALSGTSDLALDVAEFMRVRIPARGGLGRNNAAAAAYLAYGERSGS